MLVVTAHLLPAVINTEPTQQHCSVQTAGCRLTWRRAALQAVECNRNMQLFLLLMIEKKEQFSDQRVYLRGSGGQGAQAEVHNSSRNTQKREALGHDAIGQNVHDVERGLHATRCVHDPEHS